jgi:uncharacterized coiled-coil protein SlyX|tara:strand:+ start:305 stop:514 length:210 start_codon:yes stop_codon:yes gene_type:complete
MASDPDTRIEELEIKLSYQEDYIRQLDEVVQGHSDILDNLSHQLEMLRKQVTTPADQEAPMEEQVPPHY